MSCIWRHLAAWWVDAFEAFLARPEELQYVKDSLQRSDVKNQLESNEEDLSRMEIDLIKMIDNVLLDAKGRRARGDVVGCKKKLFEKKVLDNQLGRLRASQHVICMHLGTVRGAELNRTLMETLKASGDAMRLLGSSKDNVQVIEDVMFDLEAEMRNAQEISEVLSRPPISSDFMSSNPTDEDIELSFAELMAEDDDSETTRFEQAVQRERVSVFPQSTNLRRASSVSNVELKPAAVRIGSHHVRSVSQLPDDLDFATAL